MPVKASTARLVQRVRRAYIASYNKNPADYRRSSGGEENGVQYVYIFLSDLFYPPIVGAKGYGYT